MTPGTGSTAEHVGGPGRQPGNSSGGVGRDTMLTLGSRLLLTAVIIGADVILARALGPDGKGAFYLLVLFPSLVALAVGMGLDRSLAIVVARSREAARSGFANVVLWTLMVGGLATIVSVALFGPGTLSGPLRSVLPGISDSQFLLGALAIPGELFFGVGLLGLVGRRRIVSYNAVRLLRRGLLLLLTATVVASLGLSLEGALTLNLITLVVTVLAIVLAVRRDGSLGLRPDLALLREQLRFGSRTVLGALAERLSYRVDAFLVNLLIGVSATGVYSVAAGLAEVLWYLPNALGLVLFSRAVIPGTDSTALASTMTRLVVTLGIILALPLAVVAPALVEWAYGQAFAGAGETLRLLLPGVVAYGVVSVLTHFVIAAGSPGLYTWLVGTGLALNIGANLVAIPLAGIAGAAIASSISYSVTAVLTLLVFRRISGRGFTETLIIRRGDVRLVVSSLRAVAEREISPRPPDG